MVRVARIAHVKATGSHESTPRTVPFRRVEEAWFWTMAALAARRDGARGTGGALPRPCDPDDIVKCLDRLYQAGRISLLQARILRIWGDRQVAPDPRHWTEQEEARLWCDALDRLEWMLRIKGIVA